MSNNDEIASLRSAISSWGVPYDGRSSTAQSHLASLGDPLGIPRGSTEVA